MKMTVLWHINNAMPFLQNNNKDRNNNEGWNEGLLFNFHRAFPDVKLYVLYPAVQENEQLITEKDDITFIGYSNNVNYYNPLLKDFFVRIISEYNPDVIHVMGSEFPHSLSMYEACIATGTDKKMVVSLQGILIFYIEFFAKNLPWFIVYGRSFRDMIRNGLSVNEKRKAFIYRSSFERKLLEGVPNVMGRTGWDHDCAVRLNQSVNYYHNDEILRKAFYSSEKWTPEKMEPHSIFISQATYPLKGFHSFIDCLPKIKEKYPDFKVYVAGKNFLGIQSNKFKMPKYERYIYRKMEKMEIVDNIIFLGPLKEEEMVGRYLKSNVFVLPSFIENSPNSLGEAMLLGVPSISSDVGGVSDMLKDGEDGYLYDVDDHDKLASLIISVFENQEMAIRISNNAIKRALSLHDVNAIVNSTMQTYRILSGID